jgi:hypothetical protein
MQLPLKGYVERATKKKRRDEEAALRLNLLSCFFMSMSGQPSGSVATG